MSTANAFFETTGVPSAGGIRAAVHAIVLEAVRARAERARREAVAGLVAVTDGLLAEAEELNLRDVPHIPDQLRMRAQVVFESLGLEPSPPLSVRPAPTPTHLIDALFDAQQVLLDLKVNAEPDDLPGAAGGQG